MMQYKLTAEGLDGRFARATHHAILAPIDSNELSDWASWLRGTKAPTVDEMANGLIKCWWNWRDLETNNVDKRCPQCGVLAKFHVCDMYKEGERLAEALICPEHGMYFIIRGHMENSAALSDTLDQYAVNAIHNGLATQLY